MESSSRPLRQAERENTCFKDVGRRVMKARHNEAERPCSYLQSIRGMGGGRGVWKKKCKKKKKNGTAVAGMAVGDAWLRRVTEMAADGAAFEMEIKRVI